MATRDVEEVNLPESPELDLARTLFNAGNFAAAKIAAQAAVASCASDRTEVAKAEAAALVARMAPDPWARRLAIGAFVLLVVLVINYVA